MPIITGVSPREPHVDIHVQHILACMGGQTAGQISSSSHFASGCTCRLSLYFSVLYLAICRKVDLPLLPVTWDIGVDCSAYLIAKCYG